MAKQAPEKKTRVKRTFIKIMMDKVNARAKGYTSPQFVEIRQKIEDDLNTLEKVIQDSKKLSKKNKARFDKLKTYSREEIQTYLDSLPK